MPRGATYYFGRKSLRWEVTKGIIILCQAEVYFYNLGLFSFTLARNFSTLVYVNGSSQE